MESLIKNCVCGSFNFSDSSINGIKVKICSNCGVAHQNIGMSENELADFYKNFYEDGYQKSIGRQSYQERYAHDYKIANQRLLKYSLVGRVLDVGCGNGAFVDACRNQGLEAEGTNYSFNGKFYQGQLSDINFSSNHFDVVCYHDVLEHVVDLKKEFSEIKRILKPDGRLIIDFPNFWADQGIHHWRPIQHLWFLKTTQLCDVLKKNGFDVLVVENPIPDVPSKILIECLNKKKPGPDILLLPGMGDIYWVAAKIASWARENNPRVWIWNFDGRPRSKDYAKRIPFFDFVDYFDGPKTKEFDEGYLEDGRTWFKGPMKNLPFDYFISYNGILRHGKSLDQIDKHLKCEWDFPLFQSLEEKRFGQSYKEKYGRYIMVHVSEFGMFKFWINKWGPRIIVDILKRISKELNSNILFTGCEWDKPLMSKLKRCDGFDSSFIDLVNETSLDQIFGLMRNAYGCFGWCGGNTIQAAGLNIPTGMVWNSYFKNKNFYKFSVKPNSKYIAIDQDLDTPDVAVNKFLELYK